MSISSFYVFNKLDCPAGLTISKKAELPEEFLCTEYIWGEISLWFVDEDQFTAEERQTVFINLILEQERKNHEQQRTNLS